MSEKSFIYWKLDKTKNSIILSVPIKGMRCVYFIEETEHWALETEHWALGAYSEPNRTCKMELIAKIVHVRKLLRHVRKLSTISQKAVRLSTKF